MNSERSARQNGAVGLGCFHSARVASRSWMVDLSIDRCTLVGRKPVAMFGEGGRRHFSQQSLLSAIERFVRSVNNMDSTVLVPSRLRDMEVQERRKGAGPAPPDVQDLYGCYSMLKDVKNELLWGPSPLPHGLTAASVAHLRRDEGLGSSTASDTDSDFESIVTERETATPVEQTSHLATAFRHHLHGLHAILHQLADSADYLSDRYQREIDHA